jgi:type IVB pilus formation R64 PilN family outer membrane protein
MVLRGSSRIGYNGKKLALCALVAGVCFASTGCDVSEKTRQVIDQRASEAQQSIDTTKKPPNPVAYDPLTVSSQVWGGSTALRMQRGMPLPARYEGDRGITLVASDAMSINEIANAISAQTGIPIRLTALTVAGKPSFAPVATPTTPPVGAAGTGFNPLSALSNSGSPNSGALTSAQSSSPDLRMPISYEGPLSGLMERVGAYFGVNWHYDGSSISISRFETRIYTVEALPGTQQVNEGMQDDVTSGSGSSSSGSGGGVQVPQQNTTSSLTQNSKFTMDFKYWDELSQVLNSILGGQGSVVVSPSMGTVTVTTTPEVMETVSDYLNKENKRLSRQIAINVQIYSVNLGQSEDYSAAFTALIKNISSNLPTISYTTAATPGITNSAISASSLGTLSVAILNGQNATPAQIAANGGINPYDNTHPDLFNALSTIGDTTSVAQFPMTTLNNRPVSRRVGTDTAYISTITNTSTATTTTPQNTYTPVVSTIHDGFSLQLTPRLLDDGRILLQYSLSLIGLDSLGPTNFNTGSGTIPLDLPITNNRIFVQQSMLRSGSTLIIGGVDQENLAQNKAGVGSPDNFLLGGGVSSNNSHFMLIMAITPQVMDVAGDGEHG